LDNQEQIAEQNTPKKKKHRKKLLVQISLLTLIPIFVMGVLFVLIGMYVLRQSSIQEMFKSLRGSAVIAAEYFSSIHGVYHMQDGELYCDDKRMMDELPFLENEKKAFGNEMSVFYGNNRVMTTLTDENGKSLLGTMHADNRIVSEVFKGNIVSTEKTIIAKERYLCVYVPIYNNNKVVGMIGSAISMHEFYRMNRLLNIYIIILTIITCLITALLISIFSRHLVKRLMVIRDYMEELVTKQTAEQKMDKIAFNPNDEIAELANHAITAATSIKTLMGTDSLTGLYNRRAGRQFLKKLWEKAHADLSVFSIVIGDIDHFKAINDKYGHDVGDTVLTGVSNIMKKHMDETSFAIRWGGEEFLLGFELPRDETQTIIKEIAKEIKREAFFGADKSVFHLSMTFGIASYAGQENIDAVIKLADDNLYKGKNQGRDCIIS
jgi:diguanylate cyclase (GGDEF)-like protein